MYSLTSTELGTESQVWIVTPPSSEERCRPGVTLNFEEYFRIKMGYSKVQNILESITESLRQEALQYNCSFFPLGSQFIQLACRQFPEGYNAIFDLMLTDFFSYNDRMQTDLTSEHSKETFLVCTLNHSFLPPIDQLGNLIYCFVNLCKKEKSLSVKHDI